MAGILIAIFLTISYIFSYLRDAVSYFLALLCATTAVFLTDRYSKYGSLLGGVCLSLSMGILGVIIYFVMLKVFLYYKNLELYTYKGTDIMEKIALFEIPQLFNLYFIIE